MWYKINVYNKPHTDGLTTVIRIICDIRLMFIINHTDGLTTVIPIICDIRLMFIINTHWRTDNGNTYYMWYKINVYNKPHTDGLTTVIRIICVI